jgi:hypothetical protein
MEKLRFFSRLLPYLACLHGGVVSILEVFFPSLHDPDFNRWEVDEGCGSYIRSYGMEKNAHAAACHSPGMHVRQPCLCSSHGRGSHSRTDRDVWHSSCEWLSRILPRPVQQTLVASSPCLHVPVAMTSFRFDILVTARDSLPASISLKVQVGGEWNSPVVDPL